MDGYGISWILQRVLRLAASMQVMHTKHRVQNRSILKTKTESTCFQDIQVNLKTATSPSRPAQSLLGYGLPQQNWCAPGTVWLLQTVLEHQSPCRGIWGIKHVFYSKCCLSFDRLKEAKFNLNTFPCQWQPWSFNFNIKSETKLPGWSWTFLSDHSNHHRCHE